LFIYVEKSKTEKNRIGFTVLVPPGSSPQLCPHRWFRLYSTLRNPSSTFFFHTDGSTDQLARNTPNQILKRLLESVNVSSSSYGFHSCRSGGATAAADIPGLEAILIKRHGNWKSDAFYNYIRDSWESKLQVKIF
jgi:hypothetical protein